MQVSSILLIEVHQKLVEMVDTLKGGLEMCSLSAIMSALFSSSLVLIPPTTRVALTESSRCMHGHKERSVEDKVAYKSFLIIAKKYRIFPTFNLQVFSFTSIINLLTIISRRYAARREPLCEKHRHHGPTRSQINSNKNDNNVTVTIE